MEKVGKDPKSSPLVTAGWLSKVFFCWLNPLFSIGYKRQLEEEDMYTVVPEDQSETLGLQLQRSWDVELQEAAREMRTPRLTRVIMSCHWKTYSLCGIVTLFEEIIKVIQPLFLGKLTRFFEFYDPEDQQALYEAYGYAVGLSLTSLILAVIHHQYFYETQRIGMKIRVALCHMIYKKALLLNHSSLGKTTTGQIVNLLSNDVNKFDEVTIFLHFLWVGPLQAAVVVGLLWMEIGPSCLAGMVVLLFLMPVQTMFGHLFSKYRSLTAVLTDDRIRTMSEVLSGIRIIKMYAWEKPFTALVSEVRRNEISMIMKTSYLRGLNMASFFCANKVILFITFTIYVLLGNPMTASRVFVTVSLYTAVRLTVTLFFPAAIERLSEGLVSAARIQEFLMLDEIKRTSCALPQEEEEEEEEEEWEEEEEEEEEKKKKKKKKKKNASVEIQDLFCYWDKSLDVPSLQAVSLTLDSNKLLAVIGPVGAGKSSLLSSILGELAMDKGVLKVDGQLTYASQQPWVFPGTIRSNVLFGKELNHSKYERVLKACALKRDLELLPDGDLSLIGDRGATLSGGQKARVNLARAVYQDADIYLLDDPLSAVDAEVGRHLFEHVTKCFPVKVEDEADCLNQTRKRCICGLLKNKPRILVTHQLQYLQSADEILVLKEGFMVAKGTYTELQQCGVDFTSLLKEEEKQQPPQDVQNRIRTLSQVETVQIMTEESRSQGTIKVGLYVKYLSAGANVAFLIVILLVNILAQVAFIMQDWWLAYWTEEQDRISGNVTVGQNVTAELDKGFFLGVYAGLTAATLVLGFFRNMIMFNLLVNSAKSLHEQMFTAALRAPVHFFDTNPIGRVLNRFSKDLGLLDSTMPWTFTDFIQCFLQIVGVIAVAASVIPWILIPLFPLMLVFLYLRRYFLQTSRDLKRLESTTRSPVFSHLSSSLNGLWTIRAFRSEQRFQKQFDAHQDLHSEAWSLFLSTSRWFAIRLDSLCAVFIIMATFGCLLLRGQLEAGSVGLALTYCVTLVGLFQWGVRQSAEVENMMTSVERAVEYTELESEAPWETQKRPPPDWPRKGLVTFDQVSFSYSKDGPMVLKDLKVMFRPKEKVGIVGRTGAGKSSLVSALFRLAEPEGEIYIDGVLTSEIGLHDLRQKMSIIPQDPVLFTGSMRKNLDPFNQHSDEDLWDVLKEVQLRPVVEELPGKLDTVLAESGSNFSVGQRQLVCLARAILTKNRVLIIDEATANVDPRTDELIQTTIRDKFRECTVLTIAHRLNTIIDSDRILVLDAGRVSAYDEPYTLLQDPHGIFYNMVQQTGKKEAVALLGAAKLAFDGRSRSDAATGHRDDLVFWETAM